MGCALMGRLLMGQAPMGRALMGWAIMGWALMGLALLGRAFMGPWANTSFFPPPWSKAINVLIYMAASHIRGYAGISNKVSVG